MGVISGKLGNMVGQKNSLVSNKDKQVWRVYQGNVANPKTIKQAHQRSLFVATKNFQRAFEDILNHSWQGVEYGTKSLNHFRSMVLAGGGSGFNFYYQPKGAQNFIPQNWPISRGSLNMQTACYSDDISGFWIPVKPYYVDTVENTPLGELWSSWLAKNPQYQDGDMLTFVAMIQTAENGVLIPVYDRMIIDTTSAELKNNTQVTTEKGIFKLYLGSVDEDPRSFVTCNIANAVVGAGFIVSRQNGSKASWLRSKSDFALAAEFFHEGIPYEDESYITACLDSFMNSSNAAESEWYLNQTGENDDEQQGGGGGDTPSQTIAIESKEAALTPSGSVNAAYLTKGSLRGYIMYNGQYFTLRNTDLTATSFDEGKSFSPSLTTIDLTNGLMEEIQAAGYHFYFPIEPDEP